MYRDKAKLDLHKNATSYIEQMLETTSHKTPNVRLTTSHLENHSNKTDKTAGRRTNKRRSPMDPFTCTCKSWTIMDIGCSLEDIPEARNDRDEWQERESGKSLLAT